MKIQNSYSINNNIQHLKDSQFINKKAKTISFRGENENVTIKNLKKGFLKAFLKYQAARILLATLYLPGILSSVEKIPRESGWDSNIRVLAACGQKQYAFTSEVDSYPLNLAKKISKKMPSIENAEDTLVKYGYKINNNFNFYKEVIHPLDFGGFILTHIKRFPVETPGPKLNIFNKNDNNKNRYVLSFYDGSEQRFSNTSKLFTAQIKDTYKIPQQNIVSIKVDSVKHFTNGIDSIIEKINTLKNKDNVELMIIYDGHGDASSINSSDERIEGKMEGILIAPCTKESDVKKILNAKSKGIKTLFILDVCHSGAWIAEKTRAAIKGIA